MITENLSTLTIHKLSQEQYDRELAAGNLDENALYLTPDEESESVTDAVKYTQQDLTEDQKTQARANIGAVGKSANDSGAEIFNDYANNQATGEYAHAQNSNTIASGKNSSAAGESTIANYENQFAAGAFNDNKEGNIFEIGNGADESNRSNAFEVDRYGYINAREGIKIGGNLQPIIYSSETEPEEAAEGSFWLDLDEDGGSSEVPLWAMQPTKPSYSYDEIENTPNIPNWAMESEKPSYVYSEISGAPVISDWALQLEKPTYTCNEVGASPAGYGIGETKGKYCSDCYALTEGGIYYYDSQTANLPSGVSSFGTIFVRHSYTTNGMDIYLTLNSGSMNVQCYYSSYAKTWQPWEWVNPPLNIGTEYRTVERYKGGVVYVKYVDCGYLPNNTSKTVAHGITGATHFISVSNFFYNSSNKVGVAETATIDNANIKLTTYWNAQSYYAYVKVKYTK